MRNLLLICALVFASSTLFGQSVALKITGLSGSAITVKSANLELVTTKSPRSQAVEGFCYVITRNQNDLSAAIMSAIATGKNYDKAELIVTLKNGTTMIHDLSKVALSNYTSTNISGKTPTEQFYVKFMTDVIRPKK